MIQLCWNVYLSLSLNNWCLVLTSCPSAIDCVLILSLVICIWDKYESKCWFLYLSLFSGCFLPWFLFLFWSSGLSFQGLWWWVIRSSGVSAGILGALAPCFYLTSVKARVWPHVEFLELYSRMVWTVYWPMLSVLPTSVDCVWACGVCWSSQVREVVTGNAAASVVEVCWNWVWGFQWQQG